KCGPFRWDPSPGADQPLHVNASAQPAGVQVGQTVTFHVTADDGDHPISACVPSYGDGPAGPGCATPACAPAPAYGPWTPPARQAGHDERTYTHAYSQPGDYTAAFAYTASGCDTNNPYRSSAPPVMLHIHVDPAPATTTTAKPFL